MSIDFEKEFFDNINRQFADFKSIINEHNSKHEKDLSAIKSDLSAGSTAIQTLADHVSKQNGRIGKLEKKQGKHLPIDSKTITALAVAAIVFMIVVVAGKEGLDAIRGALNVLP